MKSEEKQALINRILNIKTSGKANRFEITELAEIALAALTEQPVMLPDISAGKYYTEEGSFKAFDYKRDLKDAIRAAGYEVQE